jgi:thiamine-phosphate pyrophosphorylase
MRQMRPVNRPMHHELRGLYAITPECADRGPFIAQVEAALRGGCRMLQYRDKTSTMPERLARARALRELSAQFATVLLINDDLALAQLVGADGVHLGQDDGSLVSARAILGPDKILGASCYADLARAERARAAGADYVAFGAAYPSPTKPAAPLATVDLFFRAKSALTVPVCAIGGITLDNARPLIAAGTDLLAVITDLFSATDIAARAAAYQSLFEDYSA